MLHTSHIELSRSALATNLHYLREVAGPSVRYSFVVKANAYGHGIEEVVPLAEAEGIDHFSVFSVQEARRVCAVKQPTTEVTIMGWVDDDWLEWAVAEGVSFFVFSSERLAAALAAARAVSRPARLHLELETGMHRTGFCPEDLGHLAEVLTNHPDELVAEGLCTHLAGAESVANHERVTAQIDRFRQTCAALRQRGVVPRYRHVACSAGLLRYPDSVFDMVRIGIASYGFWPSAELRAATLMADHREDPLLRVLSWKSELMSSNPVAEGEYVSYGTSYMTNRPSRIATVPVGYGYGFSRTLSNRGHVLVDGKRVPVVGTVNMNMAVVDVTDVGDARVGDEVVLIGDQGGRRITVSSFSDMNNSLNYELLARLPGHIPRRVVD